MRYHAPMESIAIIGAGAGGLAAAIAAGRGGAQVDVYEQRDAIGKSILVSGNGRCNLSNLHIRSESYRNQAFVSQTFAALPPSGVHAFFERLGLIMVDGGEGRLYPATNKAETVLRVLELGMSELSVSITCRRMVKRVVVSPDGPAGPAFALAFMDGTASSYDSVILAAGGLAPAQLLPTGFSYTRPAGRLCALKTDLDAVAGLDKVRARCALSLYAGDSDRLVAIERGEAQFRSFGVSGIAAFNLSRFARPGDVLCIDFLPEVDLEQLRAAIARRCVRHPWRAAVDLVAGLTLDAVSKAVLRQAGCRPNAPLAEADAGRVADAFKSYRMKVRSLDDRHAQVHRGGFDPAAFDPATLEARDCPGLHVIGEALDVDGPCGGYNLHWAWTTGILAGAHAADIPLPQALGTSGADA
ncbi:MAG: aminoacetone oxidase family FAD-binding enzyme [Eggerthellaceae bacterium]